jgi:lysophospholipase L1-like esterase
VPRLIRLARDTAISLAVSLVLLAALELVFRLFAPQSLTGTSVRGEHFSAFDSLLGIRYVPRATWRFRHPEYQVEYAINSEGFRDAKVHPARKPAGVTRVLLLGDSFTFGQAVNYEDAWPVLAERALEREFPGRVDLVKAGVQGMDTRSELILLRRLARRLDVDAVVVGFLVNDVYTNLPLERGMLEADSDTSAAWGDIRRTVFREADAEPTFHLLTYARRLVTSFDAAYVNLYLAAPARGDFLRVPLPGLPRRQLRVTEGLLEQTAAYCDSLGLPLVVLSIPQQFQVLYSRSGRQDPTVDVHFYDRYLGALAERRGFAWIGTLDAFVRADTGDVELFFRLDGHLTPAGNSIVAERFLEAVVPSILQRRPPGGAVQSAGARGTRSPESRAMSDGWQGQ